MTSPFEVTGDGLGWEETETHLTQKMLWMEESCTIWDVENLVNNGINYLSTELQDYFPPTVVVKAIR